MGNIRLNQNSIEIEQPAATDPFAIPSKHIGELLQFDPKADVLRRVKVSGQIIYQDAAGSYLLDGDSGLHFTYAGEPTAHVCDLVEVVGFPDFSGPSPVLRDAVVHRKGPSDFPEPRKLKAGDLVRDAYDSTLVKVEGVLLALSKTHDGAILEMQSGLRRFMATVNDNTGLDRSLAVGSRLELTGVYIGQGGNRVLGQPISTFRLLLNTGFDIRVLSRPPWLTLQRLLAVVGVLAGILVGAMIWIGLLHRTVDERTKQLELQILQRQKADRQREIEQERARVAQDLHDDLGAGLTRVNMLTSLANNPATPGEDRVRYLNDLREMARDMVTSLDEIVWAVNPRNDTLASLVGYFCAHTQQLLDLASVKCGLDVPTELPHFSLEPNFRHAILLAFKEAINNAIRHSGASKVWLRINIRDGLLILELEDNGHGIDPSKTGSGTDGLANMRKRLAELGGCCDVTSTPTKGTTVRFEAPIGKRAL